MQNWLRMFFLFWAVGLAVYFNSLNNKFLMDDLAFLKNPAMSQVRFMPSQWNPYLAQEMGVYRPMAHMLLDFSYGTFRNSYWKYHLFNLTLFVFVSLLVSVLVEKLTGEGQLAFLAGFFYLIHPVNGIIVNYMSASVFAFEAIFMLGAILLLLASLERQNDRGLYFLSLAFCFFSLFWHENGVMVPFYVSAVILFFRKDPFMQKARVLLPYFLIVFSYVIFRAVYFPPVNTGLLKQLALSHMSGWWYPAAMFQVYSWYIGKLFFPQGIVMQWAVPFMQGHAVLNVLGAVLLAVSFVLLFFRFRRDALCLLALTWLVIGFAPALLASMVRSYTCAVIEPHWFVFSSIGFFMLAARLCVFVFSRMKNAGMVLVFILVMVWCSFSHAYNRIWADQKTYAFYWLQQAPYYTPIYTYIAYAQMMEGDFKASRMWFTRALSGRPADELIYVNLGVMAQAEGRLQAAEGNYKMALKINPYSADAFSRLQSVRQAQVRQTRSEDSSAGEGKHEKL
jgi:tetratricopeptide (TPR) repeat protein